MFLYFRSDALTKDEALGKIEIQVFEAPKPWLND